MNKKRVKYGFGEALGNQVVIRKNGDHPGIPIEYIDEEAKMDILASLVELQTVLLTQKDELNEEMLGRSNVTTLFLLNLISRLEIVKSGTVSGSVDGAF